MKQINVAIIGLGYWGPNLVRNFLKVPGVKIKIVCDLIEKNFGKLSNFSKMETTKNYKEILEDTTVDVVAIATPLSSHFTLAKETLLSEKHVFIEKPMVENSKKALELINLAKKKKKIIMVGHTFIYSEPLKKIKKILDNKDLGKIYYYDSTRINLGLIQSKNNVLWDLAVHDFSIISYLFKSKPLSLYAFGSSHIHKYEEIAHVTIRFGNNINAHISVSWISPVKVRKIYITGGKKMIVYDDVEPSEKIKIYDKNVVVSTSKITPFSPLYRSGDIIIPHLEQTEPMYNELNHLIYCIRNKKQPITNGEQGLKVIKLLEACDLSLKTRSEVKLS